MFGSSPRNAADAYAKVSIETGVLAADPHKLIVMLFDGAIKAVSNATQQMQSGNIPEKGRSISHAISIIESGLRASLNKEVGGELAQNLDALYGYMSKSLALANLNNDVAKLSEVQSLLTDLRDTWQKIAPAKVEPTDHVVVAPKDALAPRKSSHVAA